MSAWFYILRLKSGRLYSGVTKNLPRRHQEHIHGYGCKTTKTDPAVELVYSEKLPDISSARKREEQVKRWTRAKKEALIMGDLPTLKNLSRAHNLKNIPK